MIDLRFVPLDKPVQPHAKRYKAAPFNAGTLKILDDLELELNHLSAKEIIIGADLAPASIRNDGWPKADANPRTPGVRLSFASKHGPLRYECATYSEMYGNIRAIGLTLSAQRAMERYGAVKSGQQYSGWTSLPPGASSIRVSPFGTVEDAARFLITTAALGLRDPESMVARLIGEPDLLQTHYRAAASRTHPDRGGSTDQFSKVTAANEMIQASQEARG